MVKELEFEIGTALGDPLFTVGGGLHLCVLYTDFCLQKYGIPEYHTNTLEAEKMACSQTRPRRAPGTGSSTTLLCCFNLPEDAIGQEVVQCLIGVGALAYQPPSELVNSKHIRQTRRKKRPRSDAESQVIQGLFRVLMLAARIGPFEFELGEVFFLLGFEMAQYSGLIACAARGSNINTRWSKKGPKNIKHLIPIGSRYRYHRREFWTADTSARSAPGQSR
jgi:hypothetical protein